MTRLKITSGGYAPLVWASAVPPGCLAHTGHYRGGRLIGLLLRARHDRAAWPSDSAVFDVVNEFAGSVTLPAPADDQIRLRGTVEPVGSAEVPYVGGWGDDEPAQ